MKNKSLRWSLESITKNQQAPLSAAPVLAFTLKGTGLNLRSIFYRNVKALFTVMSIYKIWERNPDNIMDGVE